MATSMLMLRTERPSSTTSVFAVYSIASACALLFWHVKQRTNRMHKTAHGITISLQSTTDHRANGNNQTFTFTFTFTSPRTTPQYSYDQFFTATIVQLLVKTKKKNQSRPFRTYVLPRQVGPEASASDLQQFFVHLFEQRPRLGLTRPTSVEWQKKNSRKIRTIKIQNWQRARDTFR